ncbi:MAG: hypothetical protein HZC40_24055 [Chloroflexi bacterium]|nr:hypothetical protein [Chloroflexota bacterium]
MNIEAEIENISYHPQMCDLLPVFRIEDFKSGDAFKRGQFLLEYSDQKSFAISHWKSPKRTRTYPYARVYDTLCMDNRITIIPFVKDEGCEGDRDFLQWDTVSLMSLLKVYVIPAYYKTAKKSSRNPNKITAQEFDYTYLLDRLKSFADFNQSDAVHWNMEEVQRQIVHVAEQAKRYYKVISQRTGVKLHSPNELDARIKTMEKDIMDFRAYSRIQAQSARERERVTLHEQERVSGEKSTLTIKNFIGGYYYWTVDEASIAGARLLLVEKKHSKKSRLPHLGDIKDAVLKMVLFTNLSRVTVNGKTHSPFPVIGLTSDLLQGYCHSAMDDAEIEKFLADNNLKDRARALVRKIFQESRVNHFFAYIASPTIQTQQILVV